MPYRRGVPRLTEIGEEPDYRFTLANERTLLAYLRSALALMAAGVALWQLTGPVEAAVGTALLAMGAVVAVLSYPRWRSVQQALRLNRPLPQAGLPLLVIAALLGAAVALLAGRW
jgi:putative membrane protein